MKENKERTKINHYESLDSWNAVDTYFTENLVNKDSDDLRVQGVRNVVEDIKNNKNLKATAIQTVGEKGWDGFILVYRD